MRPIGSPNATFSIRPITMKVMPSAQRCCQSGREHVAAELLHHLRPARQRAGDRLRKEADVERIAVERDSFGAGRAADPPDT